jgi:hypothetical protein
LKVPCHHWLKAQDTHRQLCKSFLTLEHKFFNIVKNYISLAFFEPQRVNLFSPSVSMIRRIVLGGTAVFLLSLPLGAAAPATSPTPVKPKSENTIFFTVKANHHSVLGRSNAAGTCKAYLGRFGQGWLTYPDPAPAGDDLIAVSSPDGSQFALLTNRGGSLNIWLFSADAMKYEPLTQDDTGIMPAADASQYSMAFSPDGKSLAYIARGELWIETLADRQARTLTFDGEVHALSWAPSGEALAVVQDKNLRRVAANGSSDMAIVAGACTQPVVAWSTNAQAPNDIFYLGHGLNRVDEALDTQLLMASPIDPNTFALLPGSVALLAAAPMGARTEVFTIGTADGATPNQVTQGGASGVWAFPDGQALYFMRDHLLWSCGLDGSRAKPLGAVPVDHISLGALIPLPGGCK